MYNITKRELLDLKAHLLLESNNISTINHYSRECQDPQLRTLCQQITNKRMQALQLLASNIGANIQ